MFLTVSEIVRSVTGVVRLAWFDARGMAYLDTTPRGALRSFWVAVLVLPLSVLQIVLRDGGDLADLPLSYNLLVQILVYVVGWTAFPVLMHAIARRLDRIEEFPAMVAAYNWSAVPQEVLQLPLFVLMLAGLTDNDGSVAFVTLMLIVVYTWFVLKTSLRLDGVVAAGLVIVELLTKALVSDYANHLLALATDAAE
jgi:hypothetical protein